jgi:hypothetical protein
MRLTIFITALIVASSLGVQAQKPLSLFFHNGYSTSFYNSDYNQELIGGISAIFGVSMTLKTMGAFRVEGGIHTDVRGFNARDYSYIFPDDFDISTGKVDIRKSYQEFVYSQWALGPHLSLVFDPSSRYRASFELFYNYTPAYCQGQTLTASGVIVAGPIRHPSYWFENNRNQFSIHHSSSWAILFRELFQIYLGASIKWDTIPELNMSYMTSKSPFPSSWWFGGHISLIWL